MRFSMDFSIWAFLSAQLMFTLLGFSRFGFFNHNAQRQPHVHVYFLKSNVTHTHSNKYLIKVLDSRSEIISNSRTKRFQIRNGNRTMTIKGEIKLKDDAKFKWELGLG